MAEDALTAAGAEKINMPREEALFEEKATAQRQHRQQGRVAGESHRPVTAPESVCPS